MSNNQGFTLNEIVNKFAGELRGDGLCKIYQIAPLHRAQIGTISFITNDKYRKQLESCQASAIICNQQQSTWTNLPCIITQNVHAYYAKLTTFFHKPKHSFYGIDQSSKLANSAIISASANIASNVFIGERAQIGERVCIYPGCYIGDDVVIADDTIVYSNVNIYQSCQIAARCIIHSGTVIGADGFGFAHEHGKWIKIEQIGRVIIGNDVEIGANCTIDRGAIEDTIIGNGVKIDNLVHIGHNCQIGENTILAGTVAIAGSAIIGKNCAFGGSAKISGHITICDGVEISPATVVLSNINSPGKYTAIYNFTEHQTWKKNAVYFNRLKQMAEQIKQLQQQLSNFLK